MLINAYKKYEKPWILRLFYSRGPRVSLGCPVSFGN